MWEVTWAGLQSLLVAGPGQEPIYIFPIHTDAPYSFSEMKCEFEVGFVECPISENRWLGPTHGESFRGTASRHTHQTSSD